MAKRMTPGQRRKANALIRKICCNYDNGNCIALDDGEECVCVQSISYSLLCKWFVNAVLPADKALYAEVMGQKVKRCAECGAAFVPGSNRRNTVQAAPAGYIGDKKRQRQETEG